MGKEWNEFDCLGGPDGAFRDAGNKVGGVRGCGWMTCVVPPSITITMEDVGTFLESGVVGSLSVKHAKNVCPEAIG